MSKTLNEFAADILPLLRDKTSGVVEVSDVKDALNRCIRRLINKEGIYATRDVAEVKVFPSVLEYPLNAGYHDNVNLYLQDGSAPFSLKTPDEFRRRPDSDTYAIDTTLGDRFLLVRRGGGNSVTLHNCDSLTSNGTWAAGDDAENLTIDEINKKEGSASINFDIDVSNSVNNYGSLENSTITAQDLSDYEDNGTLFLEVYIPDVTYLTSITARWGSSSSDYWSGTATTQFSGLNLHNGWNTIGIAWDSTTETGTPDSSAVDYLYVRATYSASQSSDTDFRIDYIRMDQPELIDHRFYSKYFVEDTTGVTKKVGFVETDDKSLLQTEDDDILFWGAMAEAYQIKELEKDRVWAETKFEELLPAIVARYGSDRKTPTRRWI